MMTPYQILCAFVTGVLICSAVHLLFLRVPMTPEWHSFRKAKLFTAVASVVMSAAYGMSALMGWTLSMPVMLVWFVVAGLQALLFTFTSVVFVAPQTNMRRLVLWNLIPIVVLTVLMASAFAASSGWGWVLLVCCVVCYFVQLAFYTRYFVTVYHSNIKYLEEVYADDLDSRLSWVKRLFFSALVVGVLAVAVILLMNQTVDVAFGIIVAIYYTYVAITFMNYRSRAAFVVKAAVEQGEVISATSTVDSLDHAREAVDRWVAAKRYLEPDVSVEEIIQQMGISRQTFNDYFATVPQTPFRSWRIELRIREAQRLLATDASIPTSELCTRCGYNDRSNFHKHFTKVTGWTLAEYRSTAKERREE